jgi:peptidyl-prolyl cis-trans isomerase SurA
MTIEVLWNQLIFNKFNQSIKVDKKLIKKNLSNNNKQVEFLVSEILFNVNEGENLNEKFSLIEDSIKKINFSQTATIFSISNTANKGGKLDWISETALSEMIYKKLSELSIGEHTKPILVPGGFLVLKLLDLRKTVKDFNLDQEVAKIIKKKTNQQLNQLSNIYFNKVKKDLIINEL